MAKTEIERLSDEVSDKLLPDLNFHLISFEGETGLHQLWPLAKLRLKVREPSPSPSGELFTFHIFGTHTTPLQAKQCDANEQVSPAQADSSSSSDEEQPMDVDGHGADDAAAGKYACHLKASRQLLKY